ncbi:hypothetical protein EV1_022822 [Malus domestica]
MEADEVMKLNDSFWFEIRIFKKQPVSSNPSNFEEHLEHEIEQPVRHCPSHVFSDWKPSLCSGKRRCYLLTDIGKHNITMELTPLVDAKIKQVLGVDDFDLEVVLPEGFLERIIPGLQRLGKKDDSRDGSFDESAITRSYLSKAWEVREKRKIEKLLIIWRFPAMENEIDMKDNLKWWAHIVASAVR